MSINLSLKEQILFSTTRIEATDQNNNRSYGTGFFYLTSINGSPLQLLITNKHVVNGMHNLHINFTERDQSTGGPIYGRNIPIEIGNMNNLWVMHPDPEVDLCALPINIISMLVGSNNRQIFFACFDEQLIPASNQLADLDSIEDVLMIGYPDALYDSVNNMPIVRRGITATSIKLDYNGKKEFLIDAACFPGSSGSPVMICNTGGYVDKKGNLNWGKSRIYLLGILYAGPQHFAKGNVTIPDSKGRMVNTGIQSFTRIPNNLGAVIKSERILELIPEIRKKYFNGNIKGNPNQQPK